MPSAKITSKGQITIPIEVRVKLGIKPGDRVLFLENEKGEVVLKPKTGSLMDVRGMLKWTGKPATIEEMNEVIAKGWSGQLTFED